MDEQFPVDLVRPARLKLPPADHPSSLARKHSLGGDGRCSILLVCLCYLGVMAVILPIAGIVIMHGATISAGPKSLRLVVQIERAAGLRVYDPLEANPGRTEGQPAAALGASNLATLSNILPSIFRGAGHDAAAHSSLPTSLDSSASTTAATASAAAATASAAAAETPLLACFDSMRFTINGIPCNASQLIATMQRSNHLLKLEATGSCGAFTRPSTTLYLRANSTDIQAFNDIYLQNVLRFIDSELDMNTVETVMELGTTGGLSLLYWANRFPSSQVVGVEPEPKHFAIAQLNVAYQPNVALERADITEEAIAASEVTPDINPFTGTPRGFSSLTIPLMMAKHEWKKIDLLKVDMSAADASLCEDIAYGAAWMEPVRCVMFVRYGPDDGFTEANWQKQCNGVLLEADIYTRHLASGVHSWCRPSEEDDTYSII